MRYVGLVALLLGALSAARAEYELKVSDANLILQGEPQPPAPIPDCFGPGINGHSLYGTPFFRNQLVYTVADVPEDDYTLGMLMLGFGYAAIPEHLASRVHLYHNDRRCLWTSMSEPLLPEDAAEKTRYQAELRSDVPAHVKPGDVIRVLYALEQHDLVVGPVRLYESAPEDSVTTFSIPEWKKPADIWLLAKWEETRKQVDRVSQPCLLHNPGSLPRAFELRVEARDYLTRDVLSQTETVELGPGESLTKTFALQLPASRWTRLCVTASAPYAYPPVRLVRFYCSDVTEGPRPSAMLNGEWEWCPAPGADPGTAPPTAADWQTINVPAMQSNEDTHCAWYRKTFAAPEHLRGERIILNCSQVLSEAWVYLNGQAVGHERHGSQPFEIDLTAAFKPGETNQLLIAARDWIAYSPKNQERVDRGETPIFKDEMIDVAWYTCASYIGIGGNVELVARPAVSVDDVFIVTDVREKKLSLHYRLINTSGADQTVALTPTVLDAGEVARKLPRTELRIPASGTATVTVERPWADAKLWWPHDPHLYLLQTDLEPETGDRDRHIERFGFREIRQEGISFFLNGTRVKIRSAWANGAHGQTLAFEHWQPDKRMEAVWAWQIMSKEDRDTQLSRLHNFDSVVEACDVADETGLLIKIEESDFAQQLFTFDPTYWDNAVKHQIRVADTYKNHASVVMWSAGNENMWGWLYLGEAAKTLGNQQQIRMVKAVREFDLMRRPVEFESDGDLMGGWEHHALHYPREINTCPDLPNGAWWGPLDGKTVVPYSMGPITLGEKPLTVGESCIPDSFMMPFGQSVLLGDDAYLGGHRWRAGWIDASRFIVNGFRDAEFALIDTYTPMTMIEPQMAVLKEEVRSLVGGQTVERHVNVHNDVYRPARMLLRWRLAADKVLAKGAVPLGMQPAELKRLTLRIPLPAVTEPTDATLHLDLLEGGEPVHAQTQDWTLHPPIEIGPLPGVRPALWDPVGDTAAMLKRLEVPFTDTDLAAAPETPGLIVGRNALTQAPPGPWREVLSAYVQSGGKVLILEQRASPDFLPVPLTRSGDKPSTIAHVRATDHPALDGLAEDDLRWWADDHTVSAGNYRKPLRGNWLPIADIGSVDGLVETPLLEEYEGRGSYVLCQMVLTDKAPVAPPAAKLLGNLLRYLAGPGCYRAPGATALVAQPDSPLRAALEDARLVYEDMTGQVGEVTADRFQTCIVDAATELDASAATALQAFATAGGHVMLHRATPEQQAALEAMLGIRLRFLPMDQQPNDIVYRVLRRENAGLMAGISNHDLFWVSNRLFADLRHNGGWWSGYDCPPEEWIADHYVSPGDDVPAGRALRLTRPGGLLQVPLGQGYVLLSQLRIDEHVPDVSVTATRMRSLLLTNLGCTLRGEGGARLAREQRLSQYEFFTVDLSPYANRGLTDDPAAGIVGWTNQGENDMRGLPTGNQRFAGIPFFIASPNAAVVLYSRSADNVNLPEEVAGIKIGRRADVLFFLHAIAWDAEKPFTYRVSYEDNTSLEIPIIRGQQVLDWWSDPVTNADAMARYGMFLAWQGDNPMHQGVILPGYEWSNPHPEKVIRDIDFRTVPESGYGVVPVLAAITGAVSRPNEGLVTDVIGTAGIRVRLGTQEQEIYYTGVEGLPKDHPYYAEAVAAHRAMVVGRSVWVQDDAVQQDAAARRIAWVYLDGDLSRIDQLANARIIGEGLGKLGDFAGNDRHRTYMENLAFITQQRKLGMWRKAGQ